MDALAFPAILRGKLYFAQINIAYHFEHFEQFRISHANYLNDNPFQDSSPPEHQYDIIRHKHELLRCISTLTEFIQLFQSFLPLPIQFLKESQLPEREQSPILTPLVDYWVQFLSKHNYAERLANAQTSLDFLKTSISANDSFLEFLQLRSDRTSSNTNLPPNERQLPETPAEQNSSLDSVINNYPARRSRQRSSYFSNRTNYAVRRTQRHNYNATIRCIGCNQNHPFHRCPRYTTPQLRYEYTKRHHLCTKCFSPSHHRPECTKPPWSRVQTDGEESIPHTPPKLFTPVDLSPDNDTKDFLKPPRKPSSQGSTRSVSSRRPRYSIPQPDPPAPPSRRRRSYERVTFRPSSKDSIISRRSNSSVRSTRPNKFMEKENMVVPAALKNRQRKIEDEESGNIRNLPVEGDDHYLAVTTPKEHGDATRAAGALGVKTMNKIFSRNFENRKDGLIEAREIVHNANDENSRAVFDAMVFVLGKALRDPLYSVYTEALDLLRVTVCEFMPRHQMQKNGTALAATTVEPLLAKMGNTAGDKRTPQETESVFREIANSNEKVAKGYLPPVMNSSQSGNKAEKARADIIYQSMNKYSAPNAQAGLAEDTLRRYGVKCLMSTNTDVRNVGREIVLRLYEKGDKRAVRSALPIGGKRGSLVQDIQREMDVIDRSGR